MWDKLDSVPGLLVFALLAAGAGAFAVWKAHQRRSKRPHDEWDFSSLTMVDARGRFEEAIALRRRGVWFQVPDGRFVRLNEALNGVTLVEVLTNPKDMEDVKAGGTVRMRLFAIGPRVDPMEYVCDAVVDGTGHIKTPYDLAKRAPIGLVTEADLPPDRIARWAKRIHPAE